MSDDTIEKLAELIEPSLWVVPFLGTGNLKGMKYCARKKAKRVLDAGYAHSDEIVELRRINDNQAQEIYMRNNND